MAKVTKQPVLGVDAAKIYENQLDAERKRLQESGAAFAQQLQQQAQTPSLAKSQLAASNKRNLAQTLAAAQSFGANPALRRQIQQQTGMAQRMQAQQGGLGSIMEQRTAQDLLAQQQAQQQALERANMQAGFQVARAPADLMAQQELNKFNADMQKWQAKKQAEGQAYGALLSTGGALLAASDKSGKKNIKKSPEKMAKFLDALEKMSAPEEANIESVLKELGRANAKLKKLEKGQK